MAFGACAVSAIERKATRLQLRDVESAVWARHGRGIELLFFPGNCSKNQAIGQLQGFGDGGFQALFNAGFQDDAIDDGFNGVFLVTFETYGVGKIAHLTIDASTKALLIQFVEQVFELAFTAAHDRRIDDDAFSGSERKNTLHDLFSGLAGNRFAALGAVRHSDRCVQQAEVVVDFGNGADSRSGASAGGFLFDGDSRTETFDGIDIRALDLVKKLASVGGESFHVTALAFGVNGGEGQRRLA